MNRLIIQEAAEWFVELNTGPPLDRATRARFDRWVRASPEHVRAFLEVIPIWEDGSQLPQDLDATPEQLVEWARSASNIHSMQSGHRPQRGSEGQRTQVLSPNRSARRVWVAGLAAAILLALGTVAGYRAVRYPTYVTGIGEQRSLVLPDNSVLELNARSRIRVRYSAHERAIDLVEGQALFHVAKSAARPFVVYSGETRVRAVGTEFDVYRKVSRTVITVVEGRVSVYSGAQPDASVASRSTRGGSGQVTMGEAAETLAAGEQLTLGPGGIRKAEHANLAGAMAWTQRQLVFDSTALPEVAEEFNRYNTRRLSIDAVHLKDFRVSGIFSSTDPAPLVRFLREQPGIRVAESGQEIRVWSD
jgi:transmembrane sensor